MIQSKKRKKAKNKKSIEKRFKKDKSYKSVKKQNQTGISIVKVLKKIIIEKSKNYAKSKRIFSEDFDVVVDGNVITPEKESDVQDDQRFNTEKYHKQQHKF